MNLLFYESFTSNIWIYHFLFVFVATTITIAASPRRDRGKPNDVMMRSRRRLQCCAVFLSRSLSLSFARSPDRRSFVLPRYKNR
jgi:hypothetical protein